MKKWLSPDEWHNVDLYEQIDIWDEYLLTPESVVEHKYQIFVEPSVQAGQGGVFIYDESGKNRFETVCVDYQEWCDKEIEMAAASKTGSQYRKKYEEYIKSLIGE